MRSYSHWPSVLHCLVGITDVGSGCDRYILTLNKVQENLWFET